jgi:2-polyprenyl-3-methyl-5-hydroxy-6-metoxy-1,4-benzoquinol methylase
MLEKINKCPICEHEDLSDHIRCKDHFLTGENFTITMCDNCSFLFTNPRPSPEQLNKYYKSNAYISHSDAANNLTDNIYKIARHFTLKRKLKLVNSLTSYKSILDYGCGTGDFLLTCKNNSWNISGLEPDNEARKIAIEKTQSQIHYDIEQLGDHTKYGVITLWHVLEHIANLNETIIQLKNKLQADGKLLIAVPNHLSLDAQHYKEFWAAYDVPRHLYHFSQQTMHKLLQKHGLKILKTIPMKLDSFYVSLLSEKYLHGKSNFLKSFIKGYKSNIYAKKNNKNYSSIIYISGLI